MRRRRVSYAVVRFSFARLKPMQANAQWLRFTAPLKFDYPLQDGQRTLSVHSLAFIDPANPTKELIALDQNSLKIHIVKPNEADVVGNNLHLTSLGRDTHAYITFSLPRQAVESLKLNQRYTMKLELLTNQDEEWDQPVVVRVGQITVQETVPEK